MRHFTEVRFSFVLFFIFMSFSTEAIATVPLSYSTRTRAYSGFSTSVLGDDENIGMGGATVALPTSISSLDSNPAGLTMTMGSVSAQINSNTIEDPKVTGSDDNKFKSSEFGLAVVPNDWGFAISSYSPSFEGGDYTSPNTAQIGNYQVSVRQFRLSVSKSLFDQKLSVGASLDVDHAYRELGSENDSATDVSFKVGAIYRLEEHILLGASFSPANQIGDSVPTSGSGQLPGFAQPIRMPMVASLGIGWIPNRFFRAGFSLLGVGTTDNTALLRDQNLLVGQQFTLQPRFGGSYTIGEYKNFKIASSAGTYYEVSRIATVSNRLHGTFSIDVNPWFVNTGFGFDLANNYKNVYYSVGIDIVRTLRTFSIVPPDPVPPCNGFFPNPVLVAADGLPDPLTVGEPKEHSSPNVNDVKDIIKNVPDNVARKVEGRPPVKPTPSSKPGSKKPRSKLKRKPKRKPTPKTEKPDADGAASPNTL